MPIRSAFRPTFSVLPRACANAGSPPNLTPTTRLARLPGPTRRAERVAAPAGGRRCPCRRRRSGSAEPPAPSGLRVKVMLLSVTDVRTRPSGRVSPGANWMMPPPSISGSARSTAVASPASISPRNPIRSEGGVQSAPRQVLRRGRLQHILERDAPALAADEGTQIFGDGRGKLARETAGAVRCRIIPRHAGGDSEGGQDRREDCHTDGDGGALGSAEVGNVHWVRAVLAGVMRFFELSAVGCAASSIGESSVAIRDVSSRTSAAMARYCRSRRSASRMSPRPVPARAGSSDRARSRLLSASSGLSRDKSVAAMLAWTCALASPVSIKVS